MLSINLFYLNLLFYTGIDEAEYWLLFNSSIRTDFSFINELISLGYVLELNNRLMLSPQGLALSDYIGPMFISDEVQHKMDTFRLL